MSDYWQPYDDVFDTHLAIWNPKTVVIIARDTIRPTSSRFLTHGISHDAVCFGVAYGDKRDDISCMLTGCYHDHLPSASFIQQFHPELRAYLEQHTAQELLQIALSVREQECYSFPPFDHHPIHWRIPQQRFLLSDEQPIQLATIAINEARMEKYDEIKTMMDRLGPRSLLIDLRSDPMTHKALQRRQHLKRNTFFWPKGNLAAQYLHPIGLRDTFGMKYKQISGITHFIRTDEVGYSDAAIPHHTKVATLPNQDCDIVAELIKQRYPLLLVDTDKQSCWGYEGSRRRAIVLHLFNLFSDQIDVWPEE